MIFVSTKTNYHGNFNPNNRPNSIIVYQIFKLCRHTERKPFRMVSRVYHFTCNAISAFNFCSGLLFRRSRITLPGNKYGHLLRQHCSKYEWYDHEVYDFHLRTESLYPPGYPVNYCCRYLNKADNAIYKPFINFLYL